MKRLISDLYKVLYGMTDIKPLSLWLAITYISGITAVIIYGVLVLLKSWNPGLSFVLRLFSFPYWIITAGALVALNAWLMTPFETQYKDKRKTPFLPPLVVYTLVAVILLAYSRLSTKIF